MPDEIYELDDVLTLEEQISDVLEGTGAGEFDGEENGPAETTLFLYGPDAKALYEVIEPILLNYPLCKGARIVIRPGGKELSGREFTLPKEPP